MPLSSSTVATHSELEPDIGGVSAGSMMIPCLSGRAWITGTHQHLLDPSDPWPGGYRLSDTWPVNLAI